jgi:hypothetical protein
MAWGRRHHTSMAIPAVPPLCHRNFSQVFRLGRSVPLIYHVGTGGSSGHRSAAAIRSAVNALKARELSMKDIQPARFSADPARLVRSPTPRAELNKTQGEQTRQISWRRARMPWLARFAWTWVVAGCILLLAAAGYLTPDPRGHGTHEQLGFAPCGFYIVTGRPCPTCGTTTAFVWMVHGHPWMALKTQPFGAACALVSAALLGLGIVGIVTAGVPAIRLSRRSSMGLALGFLGLFLGSWLYKVLVMMAGG